MGAMYLHRRFADADIVGNLISTAAACLVTDVQLGMTGLQLHRHLVEAGYVDPDDRWCRIPGRGRPEKRPERWREAKNYPAG